MRHPDAPSFKRNKLVWVGSGIILGLMTAVVVNVLSGFVGYFPSDDRTGVLVLGLAALGGWVGYRRSRQQNKQP